MLKLLDTWINAQKSGYTKERYDADCKRMKAKLYKALKLQRTEQGTK